MAKKLQIASRGGDVNNKFHYGIEFVMNHSKEEVEGVITKLEAKRNRQEKLAKVTIVKLNRQLARSLGTMAAERIEDELNRRFRSMYKLREKN